MKHTVYLCGPITGGSYEEAMGWREYAASKLHESIEPLSPMRHKECLLEEGILTHGYENGERAYLMSSVKAITTRDRFDTTRASLLLVNLKDAADKVSIGSMIELGWADANQIPIVIVMDKKNIHYHGIVCTVAGWIVDTLDEGIEVANKVLVPGV